MKKHDLITWNVSEKRIDEMSENNHYELANHEGCFYRMTNDEYENQMTSLDISMHCSSLFFKRERETRVNMSIDEFESNHSSSYLSTGRT